MRDVLLQNARRMTEEMTSFSPKLWVSSNATGEVVEDDVFHLDIDVGTVMSRMNVSIVLFFR
jgi:hypothetical protein